MGAKLIWHHSFCKLIKPLLNHYSNTSFRLYHRARESAITNKNIRSAFRATGLTVPPNPRHVIGKVKQEVGDEILDAAVTRKFSLLKPLDPLNLPATPANISTLRQISLAGHHLMTRQNTTQFNEMSPERRLEQMHLLLEQAVKAAERACTDRDLLLFDLNRLRNKEKPEQAENPRLRKMGEILTTDEVLAEREEKQRLALEAERQKEHNAEIRRLNKIRNEEKAEQARLRKEAREAKKLEEIRQKATQLLGQHQSPRTPMRLGLNQPTFNVSGISTPLLTPLGTLPSPIAGRTVFTPTPSTPKRRNNTNRGTTVGFKTAETRAYNPSDAPDTLTNLLSSLSLSKSSKPVRSGRTQAKKPPHGKPPKRAPPKPKKPVPGRGEIAGRKRKAVSAMSIEGGTKDSRVVLEKTKGVAVDSRVGGNIVPVVQELKRTRAGRVVKPSMLARR